MSDLLDPITSALGSIFSIPNASVTATSTSTDKVKTVKQTTSTDEPSSTRTSSQVKASQAIPDSQSVTAGPRPSTTGQGNAVAKPNLNESASTDALLTNTNTVQTKATATSTSDQSTDTTSVSSTSQIDASISTSTSASTITSSPQTTLVTSTTSSSSSASISQTSISSATASASSVPVHSAPSSNKIPTAGIVVASVVGFLILASILFLILRYCAPIRRKYDSWQEKKRLARTYREAIDGVPVSAEKIGRDGSPQAASYAGSRFYANDETEYQPRAEGPHGAGLGLGNRLSMLMQHSPFQMGNHGVRQSQIGMAFSDSRSRGLYTAPQ